MPDRLIWILVAVLAAVGLAKPFLLGTPVMAVVPLVVIAVPVLFVLLHAPRRMGWRNLGVFFLATFAISWAYESLSIATGFPFGNYHYTDTLGPKLGSVPLLIMPAYFGTAYVSWNLARLLVGSGAAAQAHRPAVVVVASFVMVMWDLSMDPSRATLAQAWIWHDGGAYFGVPLRNFAGWFLCVATIFAALAGWLSRQPPGALADADRPGQAQALGLYAALFVEFVALIAFHPQGPVADATGQVWNRSDIYLSLGLVSIFTMGFVLVLGAIALRQAPRP